MMKVYNLLIIAFSLIFFNCNKKETVVLNTIQESEKDTIINYKNVQDSINRELDWKELRCGLWINKNGEIGLKTSQGTENGLTDSYITHIMNYEERIPISSVVDTPSFKHIGSSFYKDKKNIYNHYMMSDGGFFRIYEEADYKTFEVVGNCYAKDKNHIYGERAGILKNIDYKSFRTGKNTGCFAKDKNGYYYWGDKTDRNDLIKDAEAKKMIEELDKL